MQLYHKGSEALEQVAYGGGCSPIPGDTQSEARQGSRQPDPVDNALAYYKGGWIR